LQPQQQPCAAPIPQQPLPQHGDGGKGKQAHEDDQGMDVEQAPTSREDAELLPASLQVPLYLLRCLQHNLCQTPAQILMLAAHTQQCWRVGLCPAGQRCKAIPAACTP
jgi:hypothetical protein